MVLAVRLNCSTGPAEHAEARSGSSLGGIDQTEAVPRLEELSPA